MSRKPKSVTGEVQQAETASKETKVTGINIMPPRIQVATFRIHGTSPYVQLRFSTKVSNAIAEKQKAGGSSKNKKVRTARDFDAEYEDAMYASRDGKRGIPAPAFRTALISACRLVGFKMTMAKMSVFIVADMLDAESGTPLVEIEGDPEKYISAVRNFTGVMDLRSRAMWREWSATLRIQYDADQFSIQDVTNLLRRVGTQVGIGEGRNDSRESCGMGYGCFSVEESSIQYEDVVAA